MRKISIPSLSRPPRPPNPREQAPGYPSTRTSIKRGLVCTVTTPHHLPGRRPEHLRASQIASQLMSLRRTPTADVAGQSLGHVRQSAPSRVHAFVLALSSPYMRRRPPFATGQTPRSRQAHRHRQYHLSRRTALGGSRSCIRSCRPTGMTEGRSCELP